MSNTFIIDYSVYDSDNILLHNGTLKAKNKINEFDAKVKTEEYLKKKYVNFGRLAIHRCTLDVLGMFSDIFNI